METARRILKKIVPIPLRIFLIGLLNRGNRISRLIFGKATFNEDGMATIHNADFTREPRFVAAYAAGKRTGMYFGDMRWRTYVVCWAAERAVGLGGDFVECGVNRGFFAMAVATYVNFSAVPASFYLLDTYRGLEERLLTKEEKAHGISVGIYDYTECYEAVKQTFKDYPNVVLVRGAVPDTLPQVRTERVAFLSIDMNSRDPEIAAAEYFWERLVSGAVMVLDDYGWRKHIEQKRAFDEFARRRGVAVLALPTGQGLIFKP